MDKSLLITLEYPPEKGGIANYLFNLYSRLPHDKIFILAPKHKDARAHDARMGHKIIRARLLTRFFWPRWLPLYFRVKALVKAHKIKALHLSHVLPIGYIALRLKEKYKIRYVVYCHGLDILKAQQVPRKKKWLIKILKNASGIVANSEYTKGILINLGIDESKVLVVYPCPNIKPPEQTIETYHISSRYGLNNKRVMLTVGRLVKRKGIDKVLQVLPKLYEKFKDIMYVIVGDGPELENLAKIVQKNNLQNIVRFVGPVSDTELIKFYKIANIFIMPSRKIDFDVEGFGIVYLEANLFDLPVIGGRTGGVPEAIIDKYTGLLVNPESNNEIYQAIHDLLQDPKWAKTLGKQGRARVMRDFQWRKEVQKLRLYLSGHIYG